jgi:alkyl hydroperoxide reductase subunit AhpC
VAQLCQHQDELKQFNTEVLIISFGTPKLARKWIRETCSPFTMLLDPERKVYSTYGLERSWLGTWNLNTLWFYIRMVLSGRRLRGIQGDPIQMGGNFIVDAGGIVRLAYRSKEVIDRPPVSGLLASLRGLESRK